MQNNIIIFIHLMAATIAIGASIYSLLIYLPTAEKDQKGRDENSPSYKILDMLAPTVFACLLILVGSGVYFLLVNYTSQTGLKPGYYNLFGIKMLFAIAAFFLSMYLAFSLRVQISDLDLGFPISPLARRVGGGHGGGGGGGGGSETRRPPPR